MDLSIQHPWQLLVGRTDGVCIVLSSMASVPASTFRVQIWSLSLYFCSVHQHVKAKAGWARTTCVLWQPLRCRTRQSNSLSIQERKRNEIAMCLVPHEVLFPLSCGTQIIQSDYNHGLKNRLKIVMCLNQFHRFLINRVVIFFENLKKN
jgi:hypothetical protein